MLGAHQGLAGMGAPAVPHTWKWYRGGEFNMLQKVLNILNRLEEGRVEGGLDYALRWVLKTGFLLLIRQDISSRLAVTIMLSKAL